jgi:hypothetical protein
LEDLPIPFNNPSKIKDHHALVNRERGSLFEQQRFYGWWPVTGKVRVKKKGRSKKKKEKITKLTVRYVSRFLACFLSPSCSFVCFIKTPGRPSKFSSYSSQ